MLRLHIYYWVNIHIQCNITMYLMYIRSTCIVSQVLRLFYACFALEGHANFKYEVPDCCEGYFTMS